MSSCPVTTQSSSSLLQINITKPAFTAKRHFLDKQLDLEAWSNTSGEWGGGRCLFATESGPVKWD